MALNTDLNYIGIIVATVVAFVIGGAWYSPILFAKPWMRENSFADEDHQGALLRMFVGSFVLLLVASYVLSLIIGPDATVAEGLRVGLSVGVAFVAAAMGVTYLFRGNHRRFFSSTRGTTSLRSPQEADKGPIIGVSD